MTDDYDVKFMDRVTMGIIVVVCLAAVVAMLGTTKRHVDKEEMADFDVEDVITMSQDEPVWPAVVKQYDTADLSLSGDELPEILPPLFDEPLPPLQGEIE